VVNVFVHTFSYSVGHGSHFDIYWVGIGDEIKSRFLAHLAIWRSPERHLVAVNLFIHTFSNLVDNGGNFYIYLIGLSDEMKISISQGYGYFSVNFSVFLVNFNCS